MAHIQICDLCDSKLKSMYHVCSLFTINGVQDTLTCADERYELCSDCYELIKTFIDCLRSDSDTLINIIAGDNHDES